MDDTKGVPQIPPNANVDAGNGNTRVVVGELHWWTTDFEIESVVIQYGKVKEIRFFEEWDSGRSKGICQVEFYESAAASACKDGMNGHIFNGRACVVEFASPHTIRQMQASYTNRITQGQPQPQPQQQRKINPVIDAAGRGKEANYSSGDTERNLGGSRAPNRGGGTYGQGITGPSFGMMPPQGMYRGFSGPGGFRGMLPPFQAVNSMGLPGVVNPGFSGRGMDPNGMNMNMNMNMRIGGAHPGMWNAFTNMGGEELGRESNYGGEASHEKGVRSSAPHREERERYDRDSRRREEEKDRYQDKGQSSRSRSRSDHRSRSRDADHGKRRYMPPE